MSDSQSKVLAIIQWILVAFIMLIGIGGTISKGSPVVFIFSLLAAIVISPPIGKILSKKIAPLASFLGRLFVSLIFLIVAMALSADGVRINFDGKPGKIVFESKYQFSGKVSGLKPAISVNGKSIQITDGKFNHAYDLQYGDNTVTFILKAFPDDKSTKLLEKEYTFHVRYVTKVDYEKEQLSRKNEEEKKDKKFDSNKLADEKKKVKEADDEQENQKEKISAAKNGNDWFKATYQEKMAFCESASSVSQSGNRPVTASYLMQGIDSYYKECRQTNNLQGLKEEWSMVAAMITALSQK